MKSLLQETSQTPAHARWRVEPTGDGRWTIASLGRRYSTKRAAVRFAKKLIEDDRRLEAAATYPLRGEARS